MINHPLANEERSTLNATGRVILTYADLAGSVGSGNTATLALFTTPNNSDGTYTPNKLINVIEAILVTPFSSSSNAALISTTLTVGDSGNNARLMASQELNLGNTPVYVKGGVAADNAPYVPTTSTVINAYITGTAAQALNTLTAGEVHIIYEYINGPVPASTGAGAGSFPG